MDAAAKGARSWMAPQVETGFFNGHLTTPKLWKADGAFPGMGNYMLGVTQMIPNAYQVKSRF